MYFLYAINIDRQTRLLNVVGQIAMVLGDKKKLIFFSNSLSRDVVEAKSFVLQALES